MTMSSIFNQAKAIVALGLAVLFVQVMTPVYAGSVDISNAPMAVSNLVTPNVLVIYDNSQSMDAFMNGTLVSGNDPSTRGNIGRQVMRSAIATYRNAFNWGLMTYGMTGAPGLFNTYAYYLGDNASMVFTDDCVGYVAGVPPTQGVSASNGNRRCVANPQPFVGGNFFTFAQTGDDADIQDVLYWGAVVPGMWALTNGSVSAYRFYGVHNIGAGNSWAPGAFSGDPFGCANCAIGFTPTDAGYVPTNPPITRQVYIPRGWGYNQGITGSGNLNEKIAADSVAHTNTLLALLGNETNGPTPEVKNGALFTPLRGSLQSAKTYFSSSLAGNTSPVQYTCQQNFVMLVTDGLPTGDTAGNLYSAADRANTCSWSTSTNSCTTGSFGTAANHAIAATNALRTTNVSGFASTRKDGTGAVTGNYDVQTYVVALGDTVANANALAVMNSMAYNGGTDKAIPAANAVAFQNAITQISDDIASKSAAGAAVAVANTKVDPLDNKSYSSTYNSGTWDGDLNAYAIDLVALSPTYGLPLTVSSWSAGSAGTQLDLRTSASRFIVTSKNATGAIGGVQFQPVTAATTTKLSVAQQTLLNTPLTTDGASVLAYLRGDRSGETSGTYRLRSHLLGDIIDSEPVVVNKPDSNYTDPGYSAFKAANASRPRVVFQGANDGMLHAFDGATGAESWAYIPNLVMGNLKNLSQRPGFAHMYYVDGTPEAGDVDFLNIDGASGGGDWRTILVGGLGKGGRGYYALDVTSPVATDEVDAKNKVLWEFPNSIVSGGARTAATLNMGYSFGKPLLVKTVAKGWVALVTSGYNNGTNVGDSGGDGLGHLYVVNPKTGDLIADIPTPGCATTPTTSPCGLAHLGTATGANRTVDYVYGGDLNGNLWRFNLTGATSASWSVAKFTTLVDGGGVAQPISSAPEVTLKAGIRSVNVGTGLYLGNSDITGSIGANSASSQTQTMYGLRDTLVALPTPLRTNLQQQTFAGSGAGRTMSSTAVNYATKKGWYIDLSLTGERINVNPSSYNDSVTFNTNIPSSTPCDPGGTGYSVIYNPITGFRSILALPALVSRPVVVELPDGTAVAISRLYDRTNVAHRFPPNPPTAAGPTVKRLSWRQIFN